MRTVRRWGFKSKKQLPLFMVWDEHWAGGEVVGGHVIVNSMDWPNWRLRRWMRRTWLRLTKQPYI